MNETLKRGQIIRIQGKKYTTIGLIKYKEDNYTWQEYKLKDELNQIKWLNIEDDEGEIIYSIYEENNRFSIESSNTCTYNNEKYELYEQGTEVVTGYWGNVDVDMYESATVKEYRNSSNLKIISIENWDGEIEKSVGKILYKDEIQITDEFEQVSNINDSNKAASIISVIIILFFVLMMFLPMLSTILKNKSIEKYVKKSSKYTYVTSITNEQNKEKARVYKTSLTVDKAVKDIIDNVPTGINKVTQTSDSNVNNTLYNYSNTISSSNYTSSNKTNLNTTKNEIQDNNDEDGVGIFTKNEYAYVYTSRDGDTYIQVSKQNYVTSKNENAYHSRTHTHHYYRTYSSNRSSTYTSYVTSARQSSTSSRTSSGGGTSSGK